MEQCVHWSGFWNTKFVEGKFLSHVWLKWHCLATVTKLALNLEAAKSYDQNINRATVQDYIQIEFLVSCLFRFLVLSTHHELHPNWCNFTPISFLLSGHFFCNRISLAEQKYDHAQEATDMMIGVLLRRGRSFFLRLSSVNSVHQTCVIAWLGLLACISTDWHFTV